MRFDRFVVYLLEEQKGKWKKPSAGSKAETVVPWTEAKSDTISDMYAAVARIARNYNESPTDDHLQILVWSCDAAGIDLNEIRERVKDDSFAQIIDQYGSDQNSKMNRCMKWLANKCRNVDEVLSRIVNQEGEEEGYTRQMIYSARRRMGMKSIIKDGEYYLVMPRGARVLGGTVSD